MKYGITKKTEKQIYSLNVFEGVDFSKASANVESYRSPNAVNMIRDEVGKVRKRMGYHKILEYLENDKPLPVYGTFLLSDGMIVHAGKYLYKETYSDGAYTRTQLYSDMNEKASSFWQHQSKIYILDGKTFLVTDGKTCEPVSKSAYVPLIKIAGTPSGGGTVLQQVNLISDAWREKATGDGKSTVFQLSFDNLSDEPLIIKKASLSDNVVVWNTLVEGTDFTVNRTLGKVTFSSAPSGPVYGQEDNLDIQAYKDRSELRDRINKCDVMIGFGLNGQENQLFVTGNPDFKNRDFWSGLNDPTYMGDLNYSTLGQDDSAIVCYSKLGTTLATHKDPKSGDIYIREGTVNNDEILYPIKSVINGSGAICKKGSQNMGEPLFITELGVQTITVQDLTLREYEQIRGQRINSKLLQEKNIENAVTCVYKDLYLIAINGHVYTLDRLQKSFEKDTPYSTYQYAAEYWENINANCFCVDGDDLYFGTPEGEVMKFYTDPDSVNSYNDNGKAIDASWELPEFSGDVFFRNKNIKFIAVKLKSASNTGVKIFARISGIWELIHSDFESFGYADFDEWNFAKFNFSTDITPKKAQTKVTIRKEDKVAFSIKNDEINQPFGIYEVAFIYTEKGINKGG